MGLKILSCGAGMQSTALALISCAQVDGPVEHPEVPRYDAVIYCDLGIEPEWVARQVAFLEDACTRQGIPFYILKSDLYQDYMENFGVRRVAGMPFWTLDEDGKAGKIHRRACTIEYKILMIQKFVRYRLLGYQLYQRLARKDIGAHELHIGFSYSHREDPKTGRWRATYATFKRCPDVPGIWEYCGHCFQGETVERGQDPICC